MSFINGKLICNNCNTEIEISLDELDEPTDLSAVQHTQDWSRLDDTHHLCPKCSSILLNYRTQIINDVESRSKNAGQCNFPS